MQEELPKISTKELITNLLWIALILGLIYITFSYVGVDNLREKIEDLGVWGPLVLMLAKISTLVFAPLGGSPLYPIAGAIFGAVKGFVYIFIGDALGVSICFFISRRFGKAVATKFVTGSGMKLVENILEYMSTTKGFLEARLFFIGFPEALSYAAGFTNIRYKRFILIHMVVYAIPTAILVWLGEAILNLGTAYSVALMVGISLLSLIGGVLFYKKAKVR